MGHYWKDKVSPGIYNDIRAYAGQMPPGDPEGVGDYANSYREYRGAIRQTYPGEPAKYAGQSMQLRAREPYLGREIRQNRRIPSLPETGTPPAKEKAGRR